jgi:hypothetical protein
MMENKMKKATLITIILMLAASLAACTASTSSTRQSKTGSSTAEGGTGLSTLNKMAVGIFKLEGSTNDLTTDQDKEMLTLWEAYKQVTNSDTASPQEKAALVSQIQSTLTTEQVAAIDAMNLTAKDVHDLMQQRGIEAAASSTQTSNSRSSSGSSSGRTNGGGGFPGGGGGGFPGGGGGFPGGGAGMAPDAAGGSTSGTPRAGANRTGGPAGANGGGFVSESMTKAIIDALITMLQQKAA